MTSKLLRHARKLSPPFKLVFSIRAAVTPHKNNYGIRSSSGNSTGFDPVEYPVGFQSTLNSTSDITYMDAAFDWRIPLRPFLGTIGKWVLKV